MFQTDYRCGIRWWHLDINKWFISTCALLGMVKNRKRAPAFKVLRARLNMEFKAARRKLEQEGVSSRWREQLETEYAQFIDIIKEWQQLQIERMQAGKSAEGHISIDAHQRGNHVVIQVKDDGRGMDRVAIRALAENTLDIRSLVSDRVPLHDALRRAAEPGTLKVLVEP